MQDRAFMTDEITHTYMKKKKQKTHNKRCLIVYWCERYDWYEFTIAPLYWLRLTGVAYKKQLVTLNDKILKKN